MRSIYVNIGFDYMTIQAPFELSDDVFEELYQALHYDLVMMLEYKLDGVRLYTGGPFYSEFNLKWIKNENGQYTIGGSDYQPGYSMYDLKLVKYESPDDIVLVEPTGTLVNIPVTNERTLQYNFLENACQAHTEGLHPTLSNEEFYSELEQLKMFASG